ncbi:snRNA-activating protein complex subunit 3 [Achlya hypogyna]|uniref:snRNA-activating protein complex subunit 3 n=1 Tax=Achlya hypogyna TaxID=1202772 RepID=A0A1V9Z9X5_ACHHY|nr:snRNA-activating protein complex subunit 3 [Achlya hypogyna]
MEAATAKHAGRRAKKNKGLRVNDGSTGVRADGAPAPADVFLSAFPSFNTDREVDADVDISTDDIVLPRMTEVIQESIDRALEAWNELSPVDDLKKKTQKDQREATIAFARVAYLDQPEMRPEDARIKEIFRGLKTEAQCQAERKPTDMTNAFLQRHPPQRQKPLDVLPTPSWLVANRVTSSHQPLDDVLFLFEVLHPTQNPRKTQYILALASQSLLTLANSIYCVAHAHLKNFDSGCKLFYMDKVFMDPVLPEGYGGTHYPGEIRYWMDSLPMLRLHEQFPGFKSRPLSMATTRLGDLDLRFDVPYLFLHLGSCEHVLYFRNMRLLHDGDETDIGEYPIRLHTSGRVHQKCLICHNHAAKHVTFDDPLALEDPMFYCESCYFMAHYNPNGQLIDANFRVFPYHPDD